MKFELKSRRIDKILFSIETETFKLAAAVVGLIGQEFPIRNILDHNLQRWPL